MVFVYLTNYQIKHEKVAYILLILVSNYVFCGGISTACLMAKSSQKVNSRIKEAVGSLMVNCLMGGMAFGNLSSIALTKVKDIYF